MNWVSNVQQNRERLGKMNYGEKEKTILWVMLQSKQEMSLFVESDKLIEGAKR